MGELAHAERLVEVDPEVSAADLASGAETDVHVPGGILQDELPRTRSTDLEVEGRDAQVRLQL